MKDRNSTLKRLSFGLLGILSILTGSIIIKEGWSSHYGIPVPRFAGYLWAAFGLVLILYAVFTKKIPKADHENFVVCSDCRASFYTKDVLQNRCPECNGTVEDLDGFYERHPELKDENK